MSRSRKGPPANEPQHSPSDYGGDGKPSDADRPANKNPNEPSEASVDADPHPDAEEGYDRKTKVPTTGL